MFRKIFLVFLLLFFGYCYLRKEECFAKDVQTPGNGNENTFVDFLKPETQGGGMTVLEPDGQQQNKKINVKQIELISLISVKNVLVTLANVTDAAQSNGKSSLLAKYFKFEKEKNWGEKAIKEKETWKAQLAEENLEKTKSEAGAKSFVVFAENENAIYYFLFSISVEENKQSVSSDITTTAKWNVKFIKGEVIDEGEKTIKWTPSNISGAYEGSQMKELLKKQNAKILQAYGFAFVIGKKKYIAFVMETGETTSKKNNIVAVFELKKNSNEHFEFLFDENVKGCYPTFFQWKGELFKAPTDDSKDCGKQMMVLDFNGKTFKESNSSIARLRDFFKHKTNFVNTKIGDNYVLLFTQQKRETTGTANGIYLWMTDGARVGYVGLIFRGFTGMFDGSILHTNDELFVLHQKYTSKGDKKKNEFVLLRLKEQLNNITKILEAWNKSNSEINKLFKNAADTTKIDFTDGLVGYLSGTNENVDYWKDEYFNADAAIIKNGAKKVSKGFVFGGEGAGVKWTVKKPKNEQPYNFTDPGFTLVATVEINGKAEKDEFISVLGVDIENIENPDATKNIGLLCTGAGKWAVNKKDGEILKANDAECKKGKTYSVAFLLGEEEEKLEVYVNWERLSFPEKKIQINKKANITHFYFGADGDVSPLKKTDVTITNVLLYNRPFTTEEIVTLKPKQEEKKSETQKQIENKDSDKHTSVENINETADETKMLRETLNNQTDMNKTINKKEILPNKGDSTVRVGVVNVFSFLFGVFTIWGRYVY